MVGGVFAFLWRCVQTPHFHDEVHTRQVQNTLCMYNYVITGILCEKASLDVDQYDNQHASQGKYEFPKFALAMFCVSDERAT